MNGFRYSLIALQGRRVKVVIEDPQRPGHALALVGLVGWLGTLRDHVLVDGTRVELEEIQHVEITNPDWKRAELREMDARLPCTCPVGFGAQKDPRCPVHGGVINPVSTITR